MKNSVKTLLIVFVIALMGMSSVQAQKFGHLDFAKLYGIMPGMDSAQAKYMRYAESVKSQFDAMQRELEQKYTDYQNNSTTMSDLIKQTKEKELTDLQGRIEAFQTKAQQDLADQEQKLTAPIIESAKNAVRDVAKENKYTYIFNSAEGLLLYSDPVDDVLPLVKKKLGIQ
ncbi:MAG: OmpH family outer membrane protein [Bacteroidetes bacterium]|nr:OmpH family outer membrane protein [Bacteroidota bacterium]